VVVAMSAAAIMTGVRILFLSVVFCAKLAFTSTPNATSSP
jgi:hypothetical protein